MEKFYRLVEFNVDENFKIQVKEELSNFENLKYFYLEAEENEFQNCKNGKIRKSSNFKKEKDIGLESPLQSLDEKCFEKMNEIINIYDINLKIDEILEKKYIEEYFFYDIIDYKDFNDNK